ncbi:hypothetical protein [Hymenobacter mucosus]|jgi:hypothetical protein|uniref:Uncharacterized protein n=1 Tax=Hymenobacter mucosus TaxID=1411120 RepID=A0A239A2W5_9BACT|nr:hypothetical protein [Hymenobacter mucosus]SNR89900.1 hypothetical protein SAMN06269173_110157 [Hymenobacter mucosus]
MITAPRPSRLHIEEEFYTPIPQGKGQRVQFNAGGAEGLLLLGYILRWEARYYVAGPDFAHTEQELLHAITSNTVEQLGAGEAPAARVQRFSCLQEAVAALCELIDLAYGPEGASPLEELDFFDEADRIDPDAAPEDPTYAECY